MAIVKYGTKANGELSQMMYGGLEVTTVDFMGNPTQNNYSPLFCCNINVTPSTYNSGTAFWVLQAGTGKTIEIVWLNIAVSYHGATSTLAPSNFEYIRGTGTFTPNTTPSIINPSTATASVANCAQAASGVTISGSAFEASPPIVFGASNVTTAGVPWGFSAVSRGHQLTSGNLVAIRASGTIQAGVTFRGGCFFMEY